MNNIYSTKTLHKLSIEIYWISHNKCNSSLKPTIILFIYQRPNRSKHATTTTTSSTSIRPIISVSETPATPTIITNALTTEAEQYDSIDAEATTIMTQLQIQGSHLDLTDNESEQVTTIICPNIITSTINTTIPSPSNSLPIPTIVIPQPMHSDVKRISFQHDVKFSDDDDDYERGGSGGCDGRMPKFNVIVEPPSPSVNDELRNQRINEIRRHSSHAPSLSTKEFEKEKDRRHSGFNPNLLGLDPEHMRFLNCSPAASRRISSGSLFKVSFVFVFLFIKISVVAD